GTDPLCTATLACARVIRLKGVNRPQGLKNTALKESAAMDRIGTLNDRSVRIITRAFTSILRGVVLFSLLIAGLGLQPVSSALAFPPPSVTLTPAFQTLPLGGSGTVTARVVSGIGTVGPGVPVSFVVTAGPNNGSTGTAVTDDLGYAPFTYSDAGGAGTDT